MKDAQQVIRLQALGFNEQQIAHKLKMSAARVIRILDTDAGYTPPPTREAIPTPKVADRTPRSNNPTKRLEGKVIRKKEVLEKPPNPHRLRPGQVLQPCGTQAAFQRHKRRGEPVDEACRRAENDRVNKFRNERRARARAKQKEQGNG